MKTSKAEKTVIIAHGDFDGIASATLLAEQLGISAGDVRVIFTQPFLVGGVEIPDDVENVYIVDLAVNNRDPEMTMNFIESLGTRLKAWYDHHQGWSKMDDRFIVHPTAPACAVILGSDMPPRLQYLQEMVNDAIVADTRQGELSPRAQLVEHACGADMRNDEIRVAAVKWFLGDWSQRKILETAAEKYAEIQKETERLAGEYLVEKYEKLLAIVETSSTPAENFNLTQLLLAGQEIAEVAMVIHTDSRSGEEMVTVATQRKDANLVETFGLSSGAPFRVTLPIERLEEAKKTLRNL